MGTDADLAGYEQRFRRAGLPLFIEDFSATHDIFTRATPLLGLVFVAEMLGATSLKWPFWVNLLAVLGGLAVLITGFAVLNRLRGRPFRSLPTRFGTPELATFVLLPALLPVLSEFQFRQFFGVAAGNLLLIGLVYAVVGYGLIGTTIWGIQRLGSELARSVASLVRALPLLLVFSLVLFMTADMWQVFAGMPTTFIVFMAVAFALISNLFLILRLPQELDRIERDADSGPPLRRIQRLNLSISLMIRQWMQVLVVSSGVGLFFVAFGLLAISRHVYELWGISPGTWSHEFTLLNHPLLLSATLTKVAAAIAIFTGLYYSISLMTDATYRAEFLDNVTAELRDLFTDRTRYLALRSELLEATRPSARS
ncbi:hypothetical protein F1D05_14165 [Kribbella qitaiheensis]|uniref:Uncharacterized protein n=1 Tax=Kribbella qitaiheensis TaxID=1544730 RepID=A0A7G6WXX5_9ACTN|nr:hypothetical protein [Kribbella qitaiheensis]QNE18840.1 hypothetical protein F1D05_14165 [Kribbella qitaiheensis]